MTEELERERRTVDGQNHTCAGEEASGGAEQNQRRNKQLKYFIYLFVFSTIKSWPLTSNDSPQINLSSSSATFR